MKRITIKIGSNVLTRSDQGIDTTRISSIVDSVVELRNMGYEVILISSGAVASGRSELKASPKLDEVSSRQLYSTIGQVKLLNIYYNFFRNYGISCGQVLTTKENFSNRTGYLNQKNCLEIMLSSGVVPIINENDAVSITELMFTDNDELSGMVATMMDCCTLVILSNIDGIYDHNREVIRSVESGRSLDEYIQTTRSSFGRGGMKTKCHIAQKVAAEGIEVVIANGKNDSVLTSIFKDRSTLCTRFVPSETRPSSVKRWIAHSDGFARGELHINDGATEVICSNRASSLLPVGITALTGDFEEGDIVKIVSPSGVVIALGRTSMSSSEVATIIGKQGAKPVVHYDYMVIIE